MKTTCLLLLGILLLAIPMAAQQILYDNGRDPGNIYGWPISNGYRVSNSFVLNGPSIISAANVSLYDVNVYNVPTMLDWKILRSPSGPVIAQGTNATLQRIEGPDVNYFLLNQWFMQFQVPPLPLSAGTYWLELSNAANHWGTATWWGENNGPSRAFYSGHVGGEWKHNGHDEGGSESFQIIGSPNLSAYRRR